MKKAIAILLTCLLVLPLALAQQPEEPGVTPDSFFWGLDNAIDQLTLLLTFDKAEKARKGLEIARERLLEVKQMIEENKAEAAQKAEEAHGKQLLKVKENVAALARDNSGEELDAVLDIEKELEEHGEAVEQAFGELKVKIEVKGELTVEQRERLDAFLNSLKSQTGDVEVRIKEKKDQIKIRIKQETGKSDEEVEADIEEQEQEKGLMKQEKAQEAIADAQEEIAELREELGGANATTSVLQLLEESEAKLAKAQEAFAEEKFGEAFGQATAAEQLARNALRQMESKEESEREIEVKIKDGGAEIEVQVDETEWEFTVNSTDLDVIIAEIAAKTGLTAEEITAIMEVKEEREGAEKRKPEDRERGKSGKNATDSDSDDNEGENETSDNSDENSGSDEEEE